MMNNLNREFDLRVSTIAIVVVQYLHFSNIAWIYACMASYS